MERLRKDIKVALNLELRIYEWICISVGAIRELLGIFSLIKKSQVVPLEMMQWMKLHRKSMEELH